MTILWAFFHIYYIYTLQRIKGGGRSGPYYHQISNSFIEHFLSIPQHRAQTVWEGLIKKKKKRLSTRVSKPGSNKLEFATIPLLCGSPSATDEIEDRLSIPAGVTYSYYQGEFKWLVHNGARRTMPKTQNIHWRDS